MNFLDIRTLLAGNVVCMFTCLLVMFIVWRQSHHRYPATLYWLCSVTLQFIALILFSLRDVIPDFFSIIVAGLLVTTGFTQLYFGLARYLDKPTSPGRNYVLQISFLLILAYFTYVQPSLLYRSINYSVFLMLFSFECAWLMLRGVPSNRFGTTLVGGVMAAYVLLYAGRIIYYLFVFPGNDFFHAGTYDALMYLSYQVLIIALTSSLVLMVNRCLHHEQEVNIEQCRLSEERTRLSAARLERAELASKTGNWELHLDTMMVTNSVGAAKVYGVIHLNQFALETVKAMPLPEYRAQLDTAMSDLVQCGVVFDVEYRIKTADTGEIKNIHSMAEFNSNERTVFGVIQDITDRKKNEHELERLVQIDQLSGVFSRRHFMALAERELANAARYGRAMSVLMLDIDNFKNVNDTYGHQTGDQVLVKLGQVFHSVLREVDLVGRVGGDEFAVVLPQATIIQAFEVADRLRHSVESSEISLEHGLPLAITVSIGLTTFEGENRNIDTLLARADKALYQAKNMGRNQVCAYENYVANCPGDPERADV